MQDEWVKAKEEQTKINIFKLNYIIIAFYTYYIIYIASYDIIIPA